MMVPDAENSTAWWLALVAPMRTVEVVPAASAIWEATVRFQISSYMRNSSPRSSERTLAGVRNESPGGADRLVRLLSVGVLARVHPRRTGHGVGAVELDGLLAGGAHGLAGQRGRVGTHIGDVAALVQALGDAHRLAGAEPQLAGRLLDQGRRNKRRSGTTLVRLGVDAHHGEVGVGQACRERTGGAGREVRDLGRVRRQRPAVVEVLARRDALAVDRDELGAEGAPGIGAVLGRERRGEVPVFGGLEGHALAFAVHDQAQRDRLHAAGGQSGGDLAPQHGRHLVAVEAVEDAAGLLGLHQLHVDLAGRLHGAHDALFGDLVEREALHGNLGLEHLEQVPRDGLSLAVLIGGEVDLGRVLELGLDLGDDLLLLRAHHIVRSRSRSRRPRRTCRSSPRACPRAVRWAAEGRGCGPRWRRRHSRRPGSRRWCATWWGTPR